MEDLSKILKGLQVTTSSEDMKATLPPQFYHKRLEELQIGEACEIYPNSLYIDQEGHCLISPRSVIFKEALGQYSGYLRIERRDVKEYHAVIPVDCNHRWEKPLYDRYEEMEFLSMMGEPEPIQISSIEVVQSLLKPTIMNGAVNLNTFTFIPDQQ